MTKIIEGIKKDKPLWIMMALAVFIRVVCLSLKPPHFDEGIEGWWVDQIIGKGFYPYDPTNYHGPLPYYFLFFVKLLMGRSVAAVRIPAVVFGIGSVYLISQFKDYVGKRTAYLAALFATFAPAMTFYSRYTPHEMGLLVFSLMTVLGYLRYHDKTDVTSLWLLGLGLVGMMTTKETFFIHVICFFIAVWCLNIFEYFEGRSVGKTPPRLKAKHNYTSRDLFNVILVSTLIMVLFYSGFFVYWRGVLDFFRSFLAWFQRGTEANGHDKVWWYWLMLFNWYEKASLLGLIILTFAVLNMGFFVIFRFFGKKISLLFFNNENLRARHWLRLISIYGFGVYLIYSIIPYKTPWCLIQFMWPCLFVLASVLGQVMEKQEPFAVSVIAVLLGLEIYHSSSLIFIHYSDNLEPYVYVQTHNEIMTIDEKLRALVNEDVNNYHFTIKIYMDDTWPLAWLWADFTRINWMGSGGYENPDAPLVLADLAKRQQIESHMKGNYYFQIFRLRDAQEQSIVYFETEKFKRFFDASAPIFKGAAK
jgi:uncharacterized protein (TIGR03663 family)